MAGAGRTRIGTAGLTVILGQCGPYINPNQSEEKVSLWIGSAVAQQGFTEAIECYHCEDKAYNSSCGEPHTLDDLSVLQVVKCKRGACVKLTYYENHELVMRRGCSVKMNIHIVYDVVCRTERNDNGYLCMCNTDLCNAAMNNVQSPFLWILCTLTGCLKFIRPRSLTELLQEYSA